VQNWNKSKRYGELLARHAGKYNITTANGADTQPETAKQKQRDA